jgi:hypothetical protein
LTHFSDPFCDAVIGLSTTSARYAKIILFALKGNKKIIEGWPVERVCPLARHLPKRSSSLGGNDKL